VRGLFDPVQVGARRFPSIALVVLATIGASLLVIVAVTEWRHFNDEHAYWLAATRLAMGGPLYDPAAAPNTPFAYWYPPPLAQVLAPFTSIVSADAFSVAWTALLLACLWWLGGRNVLVALALIAFLPVAVELRVRNVHLVVALLVVLALRRSWGFWVPAAALKITPVLGIAYLAAAGRVRDAVKVGVLGLALLVVSFVLGPDAWRAFLDVVGARAGTDGGSLVAIPFALRFGAGVLLTIVAGLLAARAAHEGRPARVAEILLVVALTIANPTLWATAFSILIAIVPLWRTSVAPAVVVMSPGKSRVQGNVIAG
jgi:Glycosyltransferase family 87